MIRLTDIPFPQALKDLLGSNQMSDKTLTLLNDGWNKLSLDERRGLADRIASESDPLRRVIIALEGIIPTLSN